MALSARQAVGEAACLGPSQVHAPRRRNQAQPMARPLSTCGSSFSLICSRLCDRNLAVQACRKAAELPLRPQSGGSAGRDPPESAEPICACLMGRVSSQPALTVAWADPGRSCLLRSLLAPRSHCATCDSQPVPASGPTSDIAATAGIRDCWLLPRDWMFHVKPPHFSGVHDIGRLD